MYDYEVDVIDSVMLSGAAIQIYNGRDSTTCHISKQVPLKHHDMAMSFTSMMESIGIEFYDKYPIIRPTILTDAWYSISCADGDVLPRHYYRWYNNNIRCVPEDIIISNRVLAYWFMGSSYKSPTIYNKENHEIKFPVPKSNGEILLPKLKEFGVSGNILTVTSSGNRAILVTGIADINHIIDVTMHYILNSYNDHLIKPKYEKRQSSKSIGYAERLINMKVGDIILVEHYDLTCVKEPKGFYTCGLANRIRTISGSYGYKFKTHHTSNHVTTVERIK